METVLKKIFPFFQTNITFQMWPSLGRGGGMKRSTLVVRRSKIRITRRWS